MTQSTYRRLLFFITVLTIAQLLPGQTRVYDAFIHGNKVGEMKVVREVNDESEKISVSTYIVAHMIVKIRVDFESYSTYMEGKLMESEAVTKTNGHIHSKAHSIFKEGYYEVTVGKKTKRIDRPKLFGGDLFYLEEPVNIDEAYALATGDMLEVIKQEEGEYYFEHDGKKELHKYVEGQLKELHLEHKLYTVIFKLQNN